MNIKKVTLSNFRNFNHVNEVEFPDDALLVAAAPNATGKTNFLEALVILLRGKSFRATMEECVQWGADNLVIRGDIQNKDSLVTVGVHYHKPTRRLRIEEDKLPASPVTFFNHYPFVLFLPDDTFLFARGPAQRRNYLNRVLVSAPSYVSALVQYQRLLKQRNAALKSARNYSDISMWTGLLIEHGSVLWRYRENLADYLNTNINSIYQQISGEERLFAVRLIKGMEGDSYSDSLEHSFSYEQRYGHTLSGPHRDDFEITTDNRPISSVLSQGQTRSVVISLKLAAYRYIETLTKKQPILLFDEVLSELDEHRQEALLKNLPNTQTLLTCTAVPNVLRKRSNVHLLDVRAIIDSEISVPVKQKPSSLKISVTQEADQSLNQPSHVNS